MTLDQTWLDRAVEVTAGRPDTGLDGTAVITVGKEAVLTVIIEGGRVVGEGGAEGDCELPFTRRQLDAYLAGDLDPTVEYMRGDLKPTGSTQAILAALDVLEACRPVRS